MKKLLAVALLFLSGCASVGEFVVVEDRAARVERARQSMQNGMIEKGVKSSLVVEDTGEDLDAGDGPGPVVIVKLPELGRICMVAIHPTEDLMAVLGCEDVPPVIGS